MVFRHFAPQSVVRAYRRYGDFVSSAHMRGLGDPLAEATADGAGAVELEGLPAGAPLWVAGTGIDGSQRVVRATAPGHFTPGPERVRANAARQTESSNVSQHAIADERPDVRSTVSTGSAREKRIPLDLAGLAKSSPEEKPRNPRPRHQAPQMGEAGGPPPPRGPGYDDDLGPPSAA
jgi:hypothetical protein